MAHEVAGNPIDAGTVVDHPPRRRLLPALPWIAIVAITSAVQFVREALFDGVVFGVVGLALLIDALRLVPQVGRLSRPALVPTLVGAVAVGALLAFTPRHGIVDGIVLAGLGAVVLPFAWSGCARAPARASSAPPIPSRSAAPPSRGRSRGSRPVPGS
ncbi:hypothetical protein GCM10025881_28540 [Pseudolysinimonas kribbensis]|uniref:Uncharacterized protein n=1 Tax=Pseudolysinimonas kribbensis TaxID=433641 RepID=A0ABQ6K5Z4_9MICO|nr:hypothetical protein [Pseudolysinimonas kribbensis]GMA96030.1 hypothetical protein GCM10025881_28540 [Pseudolysinimonas kribbensis]